jgi:hypothetical protein
VANQASTACDRRFKQSVETSTPPLFMKEIMNVNVFCDLPTVNLSNFRFLFSHLAFAGEVHYTAPMILRISIVAICIVACCGCAKSQRSKSSARMYEGDSSPMIRMYNEGPGSILHN